MFSTQLLHNTKYCLLQRKVAFVMNYIFGFLYASNHYLQNSPLHLYMSETCACKINQDSYHTALNHVFIRLLRSWMSHTARQSLQGGRAAHHDIGWMPSLFRAALTSLCSSWYWLLQVLLSSRQSSKPTECISIWQTDLSFLSFHILYDLIKR